MKKIIFLSFFLLLPAYNAFSLFQQVQGIESAQIKRVVVSSIDPAFICVASKNSIYISYNSGRDFKKIAVLKGEEVQHVFFDPYLVNVVYVVGNRHFYKMTDKLERIFSSPSEQLINTGAKHRDTFLIGTDEGLYYSQQDTLIWKKIKTLSNYSVYDIESSGNSIYIATEGGLYSFDAKKSNAKRLFVTFRQQEEDEKTGLITQVVKMDIFKENIIWLGTNRGVFVSYNKGINWKKLQIAGIDNLDINCIVQTKLQKDTIYLGTNKGFFVVDIDNNKAKQIFEGLYSTDIRWVDFTSTGRIYLATAKGLFKNNYFTVSKKKSSLQIIFAKEPSITEIQQASLRYNEVHPEKIEKWRNSLRYRALLPTISLDYDKTIYGTAGTGSYDGKSYVGPRDWSIGFAWDMKNLVWDSYQDDIDTRSRLNTQLRLDILDEINRVYFERLRLKKDIEEIAEASEDLFNKKLRLMELTAIIDGYTGGFFSQKSKELNE